MGPHNVINLQGTAFPTIVVKHRKVRLSIRRFAHGPAKVTVVARSKRNDGNKRNELMHVICEF
jgi:hypothetical protein